MTTGNESVQNSPLVSDDKVRTKVRAEMRRAMRFDGKTREEIAADSRINIHTIDAWLSTDPDKRRPISFGQALSLMAALGPRSVNSFIALIGYVGAQHVDEAEPASPAFVAAEAMGHVARFARCAADNRIDHTEEPESTSAVDSAIELLAPFSSKRSVA